MQPFKFLLTVLGAEAKTPPPDLPGHSRPTLPPGPPRPPRPPTPPRPTPPAENLRFSPYLLTTNIAGVFIPLRPQIGVLYSDRFDFYIAIVDTQFWVRGFYRVPYVRVMVNASDVNDIYIMTEPDQEMYPINLYIPPNQREAFRRQV